MKTRRTGLLIASLCFLSLATARADVDLHGLFTDNMVLQRSRPIAVYGTADNGEAVEVDLAGRQAETTARDGRWQVELPALPAGGPHTLTVRGSRTLTCRNVLIGDVWLCTGQSNMAGVLRTYVGPAYQDYRHLYEGIPGDKTLDRIRLFKVARGADDEPLADVVADEQFGKSWRLADAEAALLFSATGYLFGRELQPRIDVPLGLVYSTVGGTAAESWVSPDVLASRPEFAEIQERFADAVARFPETNKAYKAQLDAWREKRKAGEKVGRAPRPPMGPDNLKRPCGLYHYMLAPLQQFPIKGAIWYQGESNSSRPEQYRTLFPALISSWRRQWGQGDFPFLFVQLAAFRNAFPERPRDAQWPWLREAQTHALELPNTGMAVAIDIGHQSNIHPPDKPAVARRLALQALRVAYGHDDIVASGPVFRDVQFRDGKAFVRFDQAHGGLVAKAVDLDGHRLAAGELRGFALCGSDGRFHWADGEIRGDTVVLTSADVPEPKAVRYAWDDFPLCNLYNGAGLPAAPFRTDDFERGASDRIRGPAVGKPVTCSHPINHPQGFFQGLTDGLADDTRETNFATNAALTFPKHVTVDLQGPHTITAIRIHNSSYGGTKTVRIQVSNDGDTFRTVDTATFANYRAATHTADGLRERSVKAVRLVFPDVHETSHMKKKNGFIFLRELELQGSPE